jgi:hypothetical protein
MKVNIHVPVCLYVHPSVFLCFSLPPCLSTNLSVCPFIHLIVCLSVHPEWQSVNLSVCLSMFLSPRLSTNLSACPYIYTVVYLFVFLFLSVCLSLCLPFCPSVNPSHCLSVNPAMFFPGYLSTHISIFLCVCLVSLFVG